MKIFQDTENPLKSAELTTANLRVMDCLDCHNRPSHRYRSPNEFLNLAMTGGELPIDLPEFKAKATELCAKEYNTSDEALAAIRQGLESLYRDQYPDVWQKRQAEVEHAVGVVQSAFARNIFPEMKVSWKAYPDHSAHLESNGCFRCHNGRHSTDSGEVISNDCNLCHDIVDQGPPGSREYARTNESLEFRHPVDIDQAWQEIACAECHRETSP